MFRLNLCFQGSNVYIDHQGQMIQLEDNVYLPDDMYFGSDLGGPEAGWSTGGDDFGYYGDM